MRRRTVVRSCLLLLPLIMTLWIGLRPLDASAAPDRSTPATVGVGMVSERAAPAGLLASLSFGPLAANAADIVLQPADIGPDFAVVSQGEQRWANGSWYVQQLTRVGRHTQFVESDGIFGVRSFAEVLPDAATADREFDLASKALFADTQELPLPAIGERSRGGVSLGDDPFDPARKVVLFRVRNVLGGVVVALFDSATDLNDVAALAQKMLGRAG